MISVNIICVGRLKEKYWTAACDEYAKKDSRIKVIHRETNGGISTARNTGIEAATGRYIGFSDCDDYMHKDMFKTLHDMLVKTDSDIVVSTYLEVPDDDDTQEGEPIGNLDDIKTVEYTGVGCMDNLLTELNVVTILPWNKLYKKELFDGVRFPDGKNGEDDFCIPHLLCAAKKVTYFEKDLYFWRARPTSYSRSFKLSRVDYVYVLEEREQFLKDKISDELKHRFLVHYMEILWDFYYLVRYNYPEEKALYNELRDKFINKYKENFGYGYLDSPDDLVPNVPLCFWSFRLMIGLGSLCVLIFLISLWFDYKKQLEQFKWYHLAAIVSVPCVYVAGQCGWILAEVGRQPWAIQGLLPTSAAVSSLSVGNVIITTVIFAVLFTALLVAEIRIMCNAINNQK